MNRREFVLSVGVVSLCSPVAPVRQRMLGVQLYTVRTELERDFEGTLAAVAEIGYREVEFAGYFGRTPAQVRAVLAAAGLAAPAAHVDYGLLGDRWEETLAAAAAIGHRHLVVPWLPDEVRTSLDGYRQVADHFNRAAESARNVGLRFGYHNQDFELAPLEGRVPLDVLLEETDPQLVSLELDVFWAASGGADPVTTIERHAGRVLMIHAKDMDAGGNMVEVGSGRIDFARIIEAGDANGLQHIFVEHDNPAAPLDSIRTSYENLRQLLS